MNNPLTSRANKVEVTNDALSSDNLQRICDALSIRTLADAAQQFALGKLEQAEFVAITTHLTTSAEYAKSAGKRKTRPDYATRAQLLAALPATIAVEIAGHKSETSKREFSTGSIGYNVNCKVEINGVLHQVTANITACGSKDLPA